MKKNLILYFTFIIMFFPFIVRADEAEDVCNTFKAAHNNGVYTVKAISPMKFAEADRNNYIDLLFGKNVLSDDSIMIYRYDSVPSDVRFNSDYTQYTFNIVNGKFSISAGSINNEPLKYDGTKCTVTLNWSEYDSTKAAVVDQFISSIPKTVYTDIDYAKYMKNNVVPGEKISYCVSIKMPHFQNLLGEHITVDNFGECLNCIGDVGDSTEFKLRYVGEGGCSNTNLLVYYDGIAYKSFNNNKFYTYPVLYIPDFTSENPDDYIKAAKKRLDAVLGVETTVSLYTDNSNNDYNNSVINYGKENGYIDKDLNKDFSPLFVYVNLTGKTVTAASNLYGVPSKATFLIAKANEETVLNNTNSTYKAIYDADKSDVLKIPDTLAIAMKLGVLSGIIMILIGIGIIIKNSRKERIN